MSRYTLSNEYEIDGLCPVLDDGKPTKAFAAKDVVFSDACEIRGGVFRGGIFRGGDFRGGFFNGGDFRGGNFWGGFFHDGVFYDGFFRGGDFHGGVFHYGSFRGGIFRGGDFHGGVFRGGDFHGGVFYDGDFRGGVYRDGYLPIQIQGSRHVVNSPDGKTIQIGCLNGTPEWWVENFERSGANNGYTTQQINEYKNYIDLIAAAINLVQK